MLASVLSVLALAAAQPDDGPVATAVPAPAETAASVDAAKPADEKPVPPKLTFKPETMVDGETLQVILGTRALFMLDDKGLPVLLKVEEGKLAAAHPEGAVEEPFEAPPAGQLAAALDGSAEKRATVLKLWNGTDKPVDYRAMALVMRQDKLTPAPVAVCAVAPRSVRTESWPAPIVAVGLGRFNQAAATTRACQ